MALTKVQSRGARRPEDRGQLTRVATHTDCDHPAGWDVVFEVLGGGLRNRPALSLGVRLARGDDGVLEVEATTHQGLERCGFGRRADDADVDHPTVARSVEQPLHLGP